MGEENKGISPARNCGAFSGCVSDCHLDNVSPLRVGRCLAGHPVNAEWAEGTVLGGVRKEERNKKAWILSEETLGHPW